MVGTDTLSSSLPYFEFAVSRKNSIFRGYNRSWEWSFKAYIILIVSLVLKSRENAVYITDSVIVHRLTLHFTREESRVAVCVYKKKIPFIILNFFVLICILGIDFRYFEFELAVLVFEFVVFRIQRKYKKKTGIFWQFELPVFSSLPCSSSSCYTVVPSRYQGTPIA